MKNLFLCFCLIYTATAIAQETGLVKPSEKQLRWQSKPFYLFMHFGPNTFTDLEWGKGTEKEELFNPSAMDCRQWCRIARAAGATGIVITAKHHDGFCLWPSKFSNHTVAQSSWRNGRGDVLRELSDACKEYGLSMGVYLSPWDRNHPDYGTPKYNEVFIHMMKEVVARYGPFFEFWWDGANGEGPNGKKQIYNWNLFESTIRSIAPQTVVFSDLGPDIRWVGNEKGIAGQTNWNLLDTAGFSRGLGAPPNDTLNQGNVFGKIFLPAECDVSIRPGWFYHSNEDSLVKSPAQLFDLYLKSVGRGANLILNVPPNRFGLISAPDSAALMGFAALRKENFTHDLVAGNGKINRGYENGAEELQIRFDKTVELNCIELQEDLREGQRVAAFSVQVYKGDSSTYTGLYTTIGSHRIISFPTQPADRIRIRFTNVKATPMIKKIAAYRLTDELVEK